MKLYGYFRSSASYRVRIALNLKGIAYDNAFIHLRRGEQSRPAFLALNPMAVVPAFADGPHVLTQSLAIIEYLEETHPAPPLLPRTPAERAWVRAIALAIACDIHPIDNLRVLGYLEHELKLDQATRDAWYRHWVEVGLKAVEAMLAGKPATGRFCHGDRPGLADACLVPQVANARRFNCDLTGCPTILAIDAACQTLDAFQRAAPQNQPDRE